MTEATSPVVGLNSSVERAGRRYHVQSEDSGPTHPHVTTHVFAGGGRVIATRRTEYAGDLPRAAVARLLREQHAAMSAAVCDGAYDAAIEALPVGLEEAPAAETDAVASDVERGPSAAGPPPAPLSSWQVGLVPGEEDLEDVILDEVASYLDRTPRS